MLTKMKLALVTSVSLLVGVAGIAAAHGGSAEGDGADHKAAMLAKYDANGDGKLDDAEKAKMKADFAAKRAARKAEMLAKYDTNKDGTLDATERAAMAAAKADERFAKLDTNHDGVISRAEFAAGAQARQGRGHGHHRGGHRQGR